MSLLKLYNYFPIQLDYCKGLYVFDKSGAKYIDTFSGIGVLSFGHSHKEILTEMKKKLERYTHLSNFYLDPDSEYIAEKLIEFTGKEGKVYFSNSGTEAIEASLKAIRKISKDSKNKIVFFSRGFHGRTTGALSINGFETQTKPFTPLLPHTIQLPYNNIQSFEKYLENNGEDTVAVFLEPVQGAGGIIPLDNAFAESVEKARKKFNFTLVCDEIQAGLGRTGTLFSYQHYNLNPDIVTVAKSLGGGLPLGAVLFLNKFADIFLIGEHGSTFAPNPVALAASKYVVDNIPPMLPEIIKKSQYFLKKINSMNTDKIMEVRAKGLMVGIDLKRKYPELKDLAFSKGLLLNIIRNQTIRLLPPLNISYDQIDELVDKLETVLCSLQ